jgi:hypothetical protein
MNDDNLYKNLIKLLKMFNNRPYHLAKFMVDNSALNKSFIKNILNSKKLNSISEEDSEMVKSFTNIDEMEDFYNSLIIDIEGKTAQDIEIELNQKLDYFIKSERFEDAAKIRDYMKRNNIKRI